MNIPEKISVGIITVSDRCSKGLADDKSGPKVKEIISSLSKLKYHVVIEQYKVVPDEQNIIESTLKLWSDEFQLNLILTTGGSGFSQRDVTPEATKAVIDKQIDGFFVAMMVAGLKSTPFAVLSRSVSGIRKSTLIVNLPGSVKGSQECLSAILEVLPHSISLIKDNGKTTSHYQSKPTCGCLQDEKSEEASEVQFTGEPSIANRPRQSPFPMVSMEIATTIVLQNSIEGKVEDKPLLDCLGYILAEDVTSNENLPPFRASIMDGYAVQALDTPGHLTVVGDSVCSKYTKLDVVSKGTAVRVSTGAEVPEGTDAVVPVENTKLLKDSNQGQQEVLIEVMKEVNKHQHIRSVGCDISKDQIVLKTGTLLSAANIGVLASIGCRRVKVRRRPVVAVFSTGDELIEFDSESNGRSIRDSNRIILILTLKKNGFETLDLGIIPDDFTNLRSAFISAYQQADVIITSGGVSMGERDFMKPVLKSIGATIHFGRVFMKPGKPTTFATLDVADQQNSPKLFFALPGNPVSSTVTCNVFALPALRKISGFQNPMATTIKAKLSFDVNLDPRPEYHRVFLDWSTKNHISDSHLPVAITTGNQLSSRLLSMTNANALIMLPSRTDDQVKMFAGDVVDALIIDQI